MQSRKGKKSGGSRRRARTATQQTAAASEPETQGATVAMLPPLPQGPMFPRWARAPVSVKEGEPLDKKMKFRGKST